MARPKCCRRVSGIPTATYFKPRGIPLTELEEIVLGVDEFEAVRLADLEGLYHEKAAAKMGISRQTFGRIVEAARKKISEVLVKGKALRIEGGDFKFPSGKSFECEDCKHMWDTADGTGRKQKCPLCKSLNIHRALADKGFSKAGATPRRGKCTGKRGEEQLRNKNKRI